MMNVAFGYRPLVQPKFAQSTAVIDDTREAAATQLFDVLVQQGITPTFQKYVREQLRQNPAILEALADVKGTQQERWARLDDAAAEDLSATAVGETVRTSMVDFLAREYTAPQLQTYARQFSAGRRPTGALADKGNFVDDILRRAFDEDIFAHDLDVVTQKVLEIL